MKNPFFWSRASSNNQRSMWWVMRSSMRLQVAQSLPCTAQLCAQLLMFAVETSHELTKVRGGGRVSIRCQQQKSAFWVILGCPVHVAHDLEVYSRFVSGWGKAEALMSKYVSPGLCVCFNEVLLWYGTTAFWFFQSAFEIKKKKSRQSICETDKLKTRCVKEMQLI